MELRKNVYKKIDLKKKSTSKLTHIHLRKHEKRDFYQDLVNNLYIIYLRFYDNKTSVSIKNSSVLYYIPTVLISVFCTLSSETLDRMCQFQ